MRRAVRSLLLGLGWASVWPAYLVLVAQAARLAPWPRNVSILASTVLHGLAIGAFVPGVLAWMTRRDGWTERFLGIPEPVGRQLCRTGRFLSAAAVILLIPAYLLSSGELAPGGRPIKAAAFCRLFILAFETVVLGSLLNFARRGSPILDWCDLRPSGASGADAAGDPKDPWPQPASMAESSRETSSKGESGWLFWMSRRRRVIVGIVVALACGVVVLDVRGYSFTARRLAVGGAESLALGLFCWAFHRGTSRKVKQNARRWGRPGRSLAVVLGTAVTARTETGNVATEPVDEPSHQDPATPPTQSEDLVQRLCQLVLYVSVVFGCFGFAWIWELDLDLIRFIASQPMLSFSETAVTVGDVAKSVIFVLVGSLIWRYMSTLFAVTVFPKITEDPGVRFAVVTLCRYAVLGITSIAALGAIHVGTAQIGMVLAALGVGLGFGLQEIVSNFVCGIIMLLERPIRIGDIVTVAATTGMVDRINIRATTIINGDNQSMIVPNREFITGNLVNWTHKDKILRLAVRVGAAYGSVPERIVELLLEIAAADQDVLGDPHPSALLEELGDSALKFALYAYVPEPGLVGRVKHRLSAEIHRRFAEEGIGIPYPTHEVHLARVPDDLTQVIEVTRGIAGSGAARLDPAAVTPPAPHLADPVMPARRLNTAVASDEGSRRGVEP